MPRALRIFLIVLLIIVGVLGTAAAAFALLFDANQLRGKLTSLVQQRTGRSFALGDIHLSYYPVLGAKLRDVKLGNATGFGDAPFLQAGEAEVGVALLPLLLHRVVEIDRVRIADANFALIRSEDGHDNWSDLQNAAATPAAATPPPTPSPQPAPQHRDLDIGGIDIRNTALSFDDRRAHRQYRVDALDASIGAIRGGKPFDAKLGFHTQLDQPAFTGKVELQAKLTLDTANQRYALDKAELQLKPDAPSGPLGDGAKLEFSASADLKAGRAELRDGQLQLADLKAQLALQAEGLQGDALHVQGPLRVEPFSPREVFKALGVAVPDTADKNVLKHASLDAQIDAGANSVALRQLKLVLDDSKASGEAGLSDIKAKRAMFNLAVDQLDIDRYLPPAAAKKPDAPGKPAAADPQRDNAPLPFDRLEALNVDGTLQVASLKLHGLSMTASQLKVQAAPGAPKAVQLGARLYKGTLAAATTLTPGSVPRLAQTLRLQEVDIGPLLKDLNGSDRIQGHGNLSADLNSAGRTTAELKRALNGKLSLALRDGALKGANLAQMVREGQSVIAGQLLEARGAKQTDFSELGFTGTIDNGVVHGDSLDAKTPAARLSGTGTLDLVRRLIDYNLQATLVRSLEGQGATDSANPEGLIIPVHISGSFDDPKLSLDVRAALQQRAADKLRGRLEQGRDRLRERLGNFLGRPPPAQTPPSTP